MQGDKLMKKKVQSAAAAQGKIQGFKAQWRSGVCVIQSTLRCLQVTMAANPIPNVGPIAVAPPNLPAPLGAGLPAQGAVPTYNDIDALDTTLHFVKASKNSQGVAVPTSTVDYVNMLTYHHAVVQGGAFLSRMK